MKLNDKQMTLLTKYFDCIDTMFDLATFIKILEENPTVQNYMYMRGKCLISLNLLEDLFDAGHLK